MNFARTKVLLKGLAANWKPPPNILISEWADRYRRLSPESSSEVGRWRTSRIPYAKAIMDAIATSEKIAFQASSQIGKTEILLNCKGFFMHLDPGPILALQPTIEMAESYSKERIAPMLRDCPALTPLIGQKRSKDSDNTILHKTFPGGHLTLAGANSPASLASRPIRVLLVDECDRFPFSAGREGDPIKLALKRTTTFWNRRIVIVSTPTIKGASRIEYEYGLSDKRKYFVPCPHCGHKQILSWGQVKWDSIKLDNNPCCERAWYECINCQEKIEDHHRTQFLRDGEWRPTAKGAYPGFHLWQAYSPWSSFRGIVQEYLDCGDNREMLKTFSNTVLGESFDDVGGEGLSWQSLKARCEPYPPLSVPQQALLLTAGVDVQKDRLVVSVWGWGRNTQSWLVYHAELFGDPLRDEVWRQLDQVVSSAYTHDSGTELKISLTCVDSGFIPQAVYNYSRSRNLVKAVKGSSAANKPIIGRPTAQDVTVKGKLIPNGVKLWTVGTSAAKVWIYESLKRVSPSVVHFPIGIEDEFFEQLVAEKLVTKFSGGAVAQKWIKTRSRNEALDCYVYALAAAHILGINRADWDKLEKQVIKVAEQPEEDPKPKTPNKRDASRGKGWLKGLVKKW